MTTSYGCPPHIITHIYKPVGYIDTWLHKQSWFFDKFVARSGCRCCSGESIYALAHCDTAPFGLIELIYDGEYRSGSDEYEYRKAPHINYYAFQTATKLFDKETFAYCESYETWRNSSARFCDEIVPLIEHARLVAIENWPIEQMLAAEEAHEENKPLKNGEFWCSVPETDGSMYIGYNTETYKPIMRPHWDPYEIDCNQRKMHKCFYTTNDKM